MTNEIQPGTRAADAFAAAVTAHNRGELQAARVAYEKLLSEFPDDARLVGKLGFVRYELEHFAEARRLFERACSLAPLVELWSVGLFHSLWKLGDTHAAFNEIRRFLRIDPLAQEYRRLLSEMHEEFVEKGWLSEPE